jgi:hypothetical protein
MKFSIRDREYRAAPRPDRPGFVRVTGQIRGGSGALLPKIVPLIVKALRAQGYPASPWPDYWEAGDGYIDFAESATVAWDLLKGEFGSIAKADPICQQCHTEATDLQRRAALALACGLKIADRELWAILRGINERYGDRLRFLWDAFEHPAKAAIPARHDGQLFRFPVRTYLPGHYAEKTPEPQEGDFLWVLSYVGDLVAAVGKVFDVSLTLRAEAE